MDTPESFDKRSGERAAARNSGMSRCARAERVDPSITGRRLPSTGPSEKRGRPLTTGEPKVIEPAEVSPHASDRHWLIGYGTLVSTASLAKDIGTTATAGKSFHMVTVPGYKRLFNVQPDHYESSRVFSTGGIERGAMNVQPWDGASFNGVLFQTTETEVARLDERERFYDRVTVPVKAFGSDRWFGEAFVYSASPGSQWVVDDPGFLMPRWKDIELARGGFYRHSREFGRMFDETTYLADGRTLVFERYGDIERYRDILRSPEDRGRERGSS